MRKEIAITLILILLMLTPKHLAYAENRKYTISGHVTDIDGKPLKNARIIVFKIQGSVWKLINITYTDTYGRYNVKVTEGKYKIIITHDLNTTPGFDYTIHTKEIQVSNNIQVNFTLMKAATIMVKGEAITAATDETAKYVEYRVEILNGSEKPGLMKNFGVLFEYTKNIGITDKTIIIPAELKVNIIVEAAFLIEREMKTIKFNLTDNPIKLSQGEYLEIEIQKASLAHSIKMVENILLETQELIREAEQKGFYMTIFKSKLSRIEGLILSSKTKLENKKYEACYVDLREAYISIINIKEKIKTTFAEASSS
ncbi:MAG TPA: carboxypeptidase regulatory-like domain-containing protein, partial [Candidatus Atribacteria bacterium]|nr:carboxypeptidase regulatory-like domain-containing protein [Candidatus Atribacteria bacterium]